ncbi:hypothetical protein D3C79_765100 [compost metagenome]
MVQPHEVEAQCRQALGLFGDFLVRRLEQRVRGQVGAPEAYRRVVLEHQLLARGFHKTALACRFLWRIEKGQVDRRGLPVELVVGPLCGVGQAKAFGWGGTKLDIAGHVQCGLDLLLASADGVFVEKRANFGGVALFEVHLRQRRLEAHLDAPALRILAPGPAAVAG